MSNPWMKFYPSDWRADPLLRACDPVSRYLWLEMIGLMHEAEPYGHLLLNGRPIDDVTLAKLAGMPLKAVRSSLKELGRMGVYSVTDAGVIFSRRLLRDEMRATSRKVNGSKGGNPVLINQALSDSSDNLPLNREDKPQKPEARSQTSIGDFDGFWKAYPKRDGSNPRKPAQQKYEIAIRDGADPEAMLAGVTAYAAEQQRKGKIGTEFVMQATKFLNQEVWRDYLDKPATADAKPGKATIASIGDDQWRREVKRYVDNRGMCQWIYRHYTPPPDDPATLVPPHILAEFNLASRAA